MSVFDGFLNMMRLGPDDDDDFYDDGYAIVSDSNNNLGIIDTSGNFVVEPQFKQIYYTYSPDFY